MLRIQLASRGRRTQRVKVSVNVKLVQLSRHVHRAVKFLGRCHHSVFYLYNWSDPVLEVTPNQVVVVHGDVFVIGDEFQPRELGLVMIF